ncbi:poly-gamma-glutamate synthesis protein (capsule biosynthesis protein) [Isoptericola variabilis J7]|uniref:Capsule synthesis protein, CapA n=1 Tax=Isoptericola variabilis (strain 225) TaxID=743718 RepID=F6FSE0_ISOV2|nr:Capsule synthesis protein, CapA [Isoptericola variabilis 225]TWH30600.1 poly-gamma-glutamate synthesis protein (capsule biosynthesis protein) [Isoptericola variabilis J7]
MAAALLAATAGTTACSGAPVVAPTVTTTPVVTVAKAAPPAPAPPATFTVLAAGDVLPHTPVLQSAGTAGGGTDFSPLLAGLEAWVTGADLALCHLEVPVAPPGTRPSGYPTFGAPDTLVRDLAEQGWEGCSTASNHSLDRGLAGVVATLDALDAAGLGHVGTARSAEEQARPQLYELARGTRPVTVAHLSATYGTNGLPVPADAPWAVDLIDAAELVRDATAARDAGADLVLVSLHAGVEYTEDLTDQQADVTAELAASGVVDLVIGHHAHVPQRVERLDGGPDGAGMWVAFGLGNMLSNQSAECCDARTSNGVLLTATVERPRPAAPARVVDVTWTATTVDRAAGHRLRALPDALADPTAGTLDRDELMRREQRVRDAVGTQATERTEPPRPTGEPPAVVPRAEG